VCKTKFNEPFARVFSRNFNPGSLAGQVIRFDLELAVKPGQDPKKPIGVVNNDLRQRFALMLAKWNGSLYHSNLYHTWTLMFRLTLSIMLFTGAFSATPGG
jgi:hypothetical protein